MIPKLRNISYEMHLKERGLTKLETRRLRGDQIEVFKILNGYESIDRNIFSRLRKREGLEAILFNISPLYGDDIKSYASITIIMIHLHIANPTLTDWYIILCCF